MSDESEYSEEDHGAIKGGKPLTPLKVSKKLYTRSLCRLTVLLIGSCFHTAQPEESGRTVSRFSFVVTTSFRVLLLS
jgi:hypothetical protein